VLVALAPVVADGVGKDVARLVEGGGRDGPADGGIALEAVLGVLVPEVEGSIRTGSAEGAVDRVERDVVDRVDVRDVVGGRVTVALEGEVGATREGGQSSAKAIPYKEKEEKRRGGGTLT
jgi:hypothetical protein